MAELTIQPVETRRQKKAFLNLPWRLYRGDKYWIPPLRQNQAELAGYKKHPFHETSDMQTFLATRDGEPVGRIAAILNHVHNEQHNEQIGFFGFFESIDDLDVSRALFTAAREWLAERDIHKIRGPVNPSMNYECGLLIDGFDSSPFFMMTYNPSYYEKLVEDFGFKKTQDLFAYWGHIEMLSSLDEKLAAIAQSSKERFNVHTRTMDRSNFRREVELFLEIYNRALVGTWGFLPMTEGEIRHTSAGMRHLIIPEIAIIGEVDGEPIGCTFGFPDYNPRIKAIDGRLFPFGFFKLIWKKRNITRMRLISTNVVPEYQRWGVGLVLLAALAPQVGKSNVSECEFSWVLESNSLSRGSLEKGGATCTKTYRLYDLETA